MTAHGSPTSVPSYLRHDEMPARLTIDSVIGPLALEAVEDGLTPIRFDADPSGLGAGPLGEPGRARDAVVAAAEQLAAYSAGRLRVFDLPLAPRGTPFRRRVWRHLATSSGAGRRPTARSPPRWGSHPGASRAVGAANGANPLPIVLPCHRVIGADGTLTGYAGGLARKAALLRLEGVPDRGGPGRSLLGSRAARLGPVADSVENGLVEVAVRGDGIAPERPGSRRPGR